MIIFVILLIVAVVCGAVAFGQWKIGKAQEQVGDEIKRIEDYLKENE